MTPNDLDALELKQMRLLCFALQSIGQPDPPLEKAKLRAACLQMALSNFSAVETKDAIAIAQELEAYVLGDYANSSVIRLAPPIEDFKSA
jgi:hypothetical protein